MVPRRLARDMERPFPGGSRSPRQTYWALRRRGEDPLTAADLTAYIVGLAPMSEGVDLRWTVAQINTALFLRYLVATGRGPR